MNFVVKIRKMAVIHLLLGSNIGNRLKQLEKAREQVEGKIGKIVKKSKVYETQPWGENEQNEFLNQARNCKRCSRGVQQRVGEATCFRK